MNPFSYQMALSRREELLRQAAEHRLTHRALPRTAMRSKPTRATRPQLRRRFLPRSA